jgi:hypothetical protein
MRKNNIIITINVTWLILLLCSGKSRKIMTKITKFLTEEVIKLGSGVQGKFLAKVYFKCYLLST